MFNGKPITKPTNRSLATQAFSSARSALNFVRAMVWAGLAKLQLESQVARPMVLVPTSSPPSRPASGSTAA